MLSSTLKQKLVHLQSQSEPYIHPLVLSFPDGKAKTNWAASLPDIANRACFSTFFSTAKGKKNTWLALGHSWVRKWPGDPKWDKQDWHAWAIAIIRSPEQIGKQLIIYDCDPRKIDKKRPRDVMIGVQWKLIDLARTKGSVNVWYNQLEDNSGYDMCLPYI
jgi:hypothetical protein